MFSQRRGISNLTPSKNSEGTKRVAVYLNKKFNCRKLQKIAGKQTKNEKIVKKV